MESRYQTHLIGHSMSSKHTVEAICNNFGCCNFKNFDLWKFRICIYCYQQSFSCRIWSTEIQSLLHGFCGLSVCCKGGEGGGGVGGGGGGRGRGVSVTEALACMTVFHIILRTFFHCSPLCFCSK